MTNATKPITCLLEMVRIFKRAANVQQTLGTRSAAGYCRNQGLHVNTALMALGMPVRYPHLTFAKPLPKGVLESQLRGHA